MQQPSWNASRPAWVEFAESVGVDPEGKERNEIRDECFGKTPKTKPAKKTAAKKAAAKKTAAKKQSANKKDAPPNPTEDGGDPTPAA